MRRIPLHIRLESPSIGSGAVRVLAGPPLALGADKRISTVTVTRAGTFSDPRYGRFEITPRLLADMVRNFEARTYGQDIFIDVAHRPSDGAAGKITRLAVSGDRLRADVEWTPMGVSAIRERGFRYLSAEYVDDYEDNEGGQRHGPVLLGAGLTVRPVIKRLDPIQLAEGETPILIHPILLAELSAEARHTMDTFLKALRAKLQAIKLSEKMITALLGAAEQSAKALGEDEAALTALAEQFEDAGKQLAEGQAGDGQPLELKITLPETAGNKGLTDADVKRILAEDAAAREQQAKKLAEDLGANHNRFAEAIAEAKGLDEDTRAALSTARDLITAEMTAEQVRKLAEQQISLGNRMMANKQLAGMGYGAPAGQVTVFMGEDTAAKRLQEQIDTGLKASLSYGNRRLSVPEAKTLAPFVARVLAEFDRMHGRRIELEAKCLAGDTMIDDISLPVGFQRTVIREALHDLNILQLVQTLTDPSATMTTQIPYETRDTSEIVNDGIVYEGKGIPRAGVRQMMDLAYILAMKLSLKLSNEVMHFTRASAINWDAYARNVESNARVMRELVSRRIANEMQRSADAYLAADVSAESIASQLDGATATIKTAQFPIVRPHQQRDLQGNAVGSEQNPITVAFGATPVLPWDGTGTQSAGTYYRVTNYNLGYVSFVDEAGDPATPNEATATISYSYATNVVKWDSDLGSDTVEKHYNALLRAVGARKAMMASSRYVMPNYLLMSPTLNDAISNAEQFVVSLQRSGSDTNMDGDLAAVKGIPAFGTNAPGIDLGDERILMGQRGMTTYTIAKPFMTGTPFEAVDSNGRPTGEKVAYGEEYNAIHTPLPIRNRATSVIVYSATGR